MTRSRLPAGCVVVGVDGSEHALRATSWAAHQASLERRTLALVHSADQMVLRETAWLDRQGVDREELTRAFSAAGRATLEAAREQARLAAPEVTVLTELVDIDPRDALVDLSEHAHAVVVGSRGRGPLRTALLGSVSASVTRRARCPVVVCRPRDPRSAIHPRVLVGADGAAASRPVLEYAFAQASLRGLPLTVMHCFYDVRAASQGSGIVPDDETGELADKRLLLAESVAGLAEKYPDVAVRRELARGLVDECLVGHAPDAELLVVGHAQASGWERFAHVSCALAVLERARTTVAVVPESSPERGER